MAWQPLMAWVLQHATDDERKIIEAPVAASEPPTVVATGEAAAILQEWLTAGQLVTILENLLAGGVALPKGQHAWLTLVHVLKRALAAPELPNVTALNLRTAQEGTFALKILRGKEHEVDWPARWGHYAEIQVEVESGRTGKSPPAEREARIRELVAEHPKLGQEALYRLNLSRKPAITIPRRLFPKKPGGRPPGS